MLISYRGTRTGRSATARRGTPTAGVMAFVVINLLTMTIPIACLWISRNGLGLDDPLSDNVSANVIGLLLANAARFFLFRTYVFQRKPLPFHLHLTDDEVEDELTERSDCPQIGPRATQFRHQVPDQRQAQPDHVVVVALDPGDERAAQAVDGERPRDVQRLAGGDVRRDLVVGDVGEVDRGRRRRGGDVAGRGVAQAVTGVQDAGAAAHRPPPPGRLVRRRAACRAPRRRARAPSRSRARPRPSGRSSRAGHRGALELGQLQRQLGRRQVADLVLVDAGDDHHRLDAGAAQRREPGGGRGGEDERHRRDPRRLLDGQLGDLLQPRPVVLAVLDLAGGPPHPQPARR